MPEPVPILKETEDQIAALHPVGDRENVRAMLMEYGTQRWHIEVERVRFDILHLSGGSVERVRSLVDLAMQDPRDVMSGEYFREGGISKPHSWAMVHEVNRKLQALNRCG